MIDVINYWISFFADMVESLFALEVIDGVSFGAVCVACIILTIVISFVFTKLVGSVK